MTKLNYGAQSSSLGAYSAHREHGFQAIVNAVGVPAAEAADIGSSVHDEIDNGQIPAMT